MFLFLESFSLILVEIRQLLSINLLDRMWVWIVQIYKGRKMCTDQNLNLEWTWNDVLWD